MRPILENVSSKGSGGPNRIAPVSLRWDRGFLLFAAVGRPRIAPDRLAVGIVGLLLRQGAEARFKVVKRDGKTLTLDETGKVPGEVLRVI